MKKIIVVLILILSIGCSSSKEVTTKTATSATVKEHIVTYKDTTFTAPKATASLKVPLKYFEKVKGRSLIDSTVFISKVFTNKNGRAKATVTILKDTVIVVAECDSIALRAQIKQELIKEYSSNDSIEFSKKVKTRGVPLFSVILYCISFLVIGAVAGYFIKLFNII